MCSSPVGSFGSSRFYVLAVAVLFVATPRLDGLLWDGGVAGQEMWHLLFLSNVPAAIADRFPDSSFDPLWSVSVEEQFYWVWPAVVLVLGRRRLRFACGALLLLAPAVRVAWLAVFHTSLAPYVLLPARMDVLAIGALIAIVLRERGSLRQYTPASGLILAGTGALFLSVAIVEGGFHFREPTFQIVGFRASALFFAALLVLTLTTRLGRVLEARVLRAFGIYSYAIYLVHLPLLHAAQHVWTFGTLPEVAGSRLPAQLLVDTVLVPLVFGVGWLSWHLLEGRVLALKRLVPYGRTPVLALAPAEVLPDSEHRRSSASLTGAIVRSG